MCDDYKGSFTSSIQVNNYQWSSSNTASKQARVKSIAITYYDNENVELADKTFDAQKTTISYINSFFSDSLDCLCSMTGSDFNEESIVTEFNSIGNNLESTLSSLSSENQTKAKQLMKYAQSKNWTTETDYDSLQKALYRYDLIYSRYGEKYGLTDYLGRFSNGGAMEGLKYSSNGTLINYQETSNTDNNGLIISLSVISGLCLLGGYIVYKKRKES